jgi:magnesium chelatase family protein
MFAKVYSAALLGLLAKIVEVEVDVSFGLRSFNIVGLPDKSIEEARERVSASLKSLRLIFPRERPNKILVNLAPADLKKEGSLYDLPIAIGYLLATKQVIFEPKDKLFIGELSLKGELRPVKGVLAICAFAKEKGFKEIILPQENYQEASLIKELKVFGFSSLTQVLSYLRGEKISFPEPKIIKLDSQPSYPLDLSDIGGQYLAKRALEISAAGSHNLLMIGPPGAGKTLLAKVLPSLLPSLTLQEALEVTKIYSIAGLLPKENPLLKTRPFRSPHHTSSEPALIGGGTPLKPGEITLAHRGVLFLDEFPEFHRDVLESLRQPLEEGKITISRSQQTITFPANFTLVAASNPCPCGYFRDPQRECRCPNSQIRMYQRKLSGPLIDRIDLLVEVPSQKYEKLTEKNNSESKKIREKVIKAREIAKQRFSKEKRKIYANSEMEIKEIKKYCQIDFQSQMVLKNQINQGRLTARGYHRILKTARTIADLEESEKIKKEHIMEALSYRLDFYNTF